MLGVTVDGLEDGCCELLPKLFALTVDVAVGTTTEVDALERTSRLLLGLQDCFQSRGAVLMHDERLACRQLLNVIAGEVEGRLQYGTLTGNGHNLIVPIEEGRPYAPRVAHSKHLAAACHAAHHVASVVVGHRGAQYICHLNVVFDVMGNVYAFQSFCFSFDKETFHFSVQAMPHQFECDVGVAVDARRLSLPDHLREYLVNVRHVEVAANTEILCPPVVAAQERMNVLQAALACRAVAQVSHIKRSPLPTSPLGEAFEHFCDGIFAHCLLTKHILRANRCIHVNAGNACTLLSAVMLFLHHQIELAKAIGRCAILFFIIVLRLQQPYQCHTAFMF